MTAQTPTPANYNEAPASWNVRYNWSGFDCQLTLRGETGADVMTRAQAAIAWLLANGAHPNGYNGNGNGKHQAAPAAQLEPVLVPVLDNGEPDPTWCPVHNVAMQRRERDGKVWYSHKNGDGYCKGK